MPWYDEPSTLDPPTGYSSPEQIPIYDDFGRPLNDAAKKIEADKAKAPKPTATPAAS
ncbi:MAG: hypothetical protein QM775_25945 [Pirellulales bacterium]